MAGRIKSILNLFSGCYCITGSAWECLRFVLLTGGKKGTTIQLPGKQYISLRKNETDRQVFLDSFLHHYHRCPFDLGKSPVIIDLGSNVGFTIIDFKNQYPSARVIGVEMDKTNYELCKKNISGLTGCTLLNAAIWNKNGFINYSGKDEQSYTVDKDSFGNSGSVRCITIDQLLTENNVTTIDFLKMDIEGAEKMALLNMDDKKWLQRVKYLSIEVHDLPGTDKAILFKQLETELNNHQFMTFTSASHWSSLFAVNKLLVTA